jgi:DNA-binding LytR/AlgR family response regulator
MIKAVLIDDEEMALEELKYALSQFSEIRVQKEFTDPLEAIKKLNYYKPDVVFLDIDMPELNGFGAAEAILSKQPNTCIVFVTAYDEYAIKAFEANAIDYLLKPVTNKRLSQTISRISTIWERNRQLITTDNFSKLIKQIKPYPDKIIVWENEEMLLLNPSAVLYFKAQSGNVMVVTEKKNIRPEIL